MIVCAIRQDRSNTATCGYNCCSCVPSTFRLVWRTPAITRTLRRSNPPSPSPGRSESSGHKGRYLSAVSIIRKDVDVTQMIQTSVCNTAGSLSGRTLKGTAAIERDVAHGQAHYVNNPPPHHTHTHPQKGKSTTCQEAPQKKKAQPPLLYHPSAPSGRASEQTLTASNSRHMEAACFASNTIRTALFGPHAGIIKAPDQRADRRRSPEPHRSRFPLFFSPLFVLFCSCFVSTSVPLCCS